MFLTGALFFVRLLRCPVIPFLLLMALMVFYSMSNVLQILLYPSPDWFLSTIPHILCKLFAGRSLSNNPIEASNFSFNLHHLNDDRRC